jgi:hypothetical protein
VTSPYYDTTAVAGTTYQYWVVAANVCGTSGSSACAVGLRLPSPPPVNSTGPGAAKLTKGEGNILNVTYDGTTCSAQKLIILFNTIGIWTGYAGCAQDDGGNTGITTVDSTGQESTWYNLVWTNGTTAGHPGFGFDGSQAVNRVWNAAGYCGVTHGDHADKACD